MIISVYSRRRSVMLMVTSKPETARACHWYIYSMDGYAKS